MPKRIAGFLITMKMKENDPKKMVSQKKKINSKNLQ